MVNVVPFGSWKGTVHKADQYDTLVYSQSRTIRVILYLSEVIW